MLSKIHIIGGPGSGKSYLARRLSFLLGVPSCDLDDVFWDNESDRYGTRNPPEVRDSLLREILGQPEWIIEGVYYKWVEASFRDADTIALLRPPVWLRDWRILRRFAGRKLGLIRGKRETFRDIVGLLGWNHTYEQDKLPPALSVLEPYLSKVIQCGRADEALRIIGGANRRGRSGELGEPRR